mgnify:CR=1 FL=1
MVLNKYGDTDLPVLKKGDLVLVTGATGFIGRQLVKLLDDSGYQVRALSRQSHSTEGLSAVTESNWFVGDICNREIVKAACNGVAAVFHLAGLAHGVLSDDVQIRNTNVLGTAVLKAASIEACVSQLIFFSSVLVEERELSVYARSKREAETILLGDPGAIIDGTLRITILRPANVYGVGMKGNIAGLIKLIKNRRLPPLPSLQNRLALISVQDLNSAAVLAAVSKQKSGKVYTLTDGESYTPSRIEAAIYGALGRKKPCCRTPRAIFFFASLCAQLINYLGIWKNDLGLRTYANLISDKPRSSEKISCELGFEPSATFESTLLRIIE